MAERTELNTELDRLDSQQNNMINSCKSKIQPQILFHKLFRNSFVTCCNGLIGGDAGLRNRVCWDTVWNPSAQSRLAKFRSIMKNTFHSVLKLYFWLKWNSFQTQWLGHQHYFLTGISLKRTKIQGRAEYSRKTWIPFPPQEFLLKDLVWQQAFHIKPYLILHQTLPHTKRWD